ncbi:MAG: hypothetical protein WDO06_04885 [Actinomycetota bacterium]
MGPICIAQVVIVFDTALTNKHQSAFKSAVIPEIKHLHKKFHIYFQAMKTDANGQIADYICWSKYVALERDEQRPWDLLQTKLRPTEFNIFRKGYSIYY